MSVEEDGTTCDRCGYSDYLFVGNFCPNCNEGVMMADPDSHFYADDSAATLEAVARARQRGELR